MSMHATSLVWQKMEAGKGGRLMIKGAKVIDVLNETLISLNEARNLLPRRRRNKRPDLSTMYRWTQKGCQGVVLESVTVGGTRCTSREAVGRFIERLTVLGAGPTEVRGPARRKRANSQAERELDRHGVGIDRGSSM